MTNTDNFDALAELGLDNDALAPTISEAVTEGNAEAAASEAAKKTRAPRVAVTIGEIVAGDEEEDIPSIERKTPEGFGQRESKYAALEQIAAPRDKGDGTFGYVPSLVPFVAGEDAEAFKRSIASAVNNLNRKAKEDKTEGVNGLVKYLTRQVAKDGAFVGVKVYRVDGTMDKAE